MSTETRHDIDLKYAKRKLTVSRNTMQMPCCSFCTSARSVLIEAGKEEKVFICEACALTCLALFYEDHEKKQTMKGANDGSGIRALQN